MRILIDARKLDDFGIGRTIRNLVGAIARLRPEWRLMLLGSPSLVAADRASADGLTGSGGGRIEWIETGARRYGVGELLTLGRHARRLGVQLYHAPHYTLPWNLPCPAVVTVHDCIHLRFPQYLPRPFGLLPRALSRAYAACMIRDAVARAARVIAVSESTRRDLLGPLVGGRTEERSASERVVAIHNGCDAFFLERPSADEVDDALNALAPGLPERFLLYVGNVKPHKNVTALLTAFGHLLDSDRYGSRHRGLGLVVAGEHACERLRGPLSQLPAAAQEGAGLRFVDRASDRLLRALYHRATLLVLPSLYEGFGLPALEAMACGTAVVVSDAGGLPEVVGGGGLLVTPGDAEELEAAIDRLLASDDERQQLASVGRARAQEFTWERAAARTIEQYEAAVAQ